MAETKPTRTRRTPKRDAKGHFVSRKAAKPGRGTAAALSIGGVMLAAGAALGAALWRGWLTLPKLDSTGAGGAEHPAPDLAADAPEPGDGRAPERFRPDPTAPVPASERESLRPATGPAPSMVADRGELNAQTGPANG